MELAILEISNESFCLVLTDSDDWIVDLFEERGLQGGGHTWASLIEVLLEMEMPEAIGQVTIGGEADDMTIYSGDRGVLESIERIIREVTANERRLVEVLDRGGDRVE